MESRKGVKKMQVLSKGNRYSPEFKAEVSLESFQRDTTIEAVRESYGVSKSVINKWRKTFKANLPLVFSLGQNLKQQPSESVEELKRIIGGLTVQLEILKKARGLLA